MPKDLAILSAVKNPTRHTDFARMYGFSFTFSTALFPNASQILCARLCEMPWLMKKR